MKQIRIETLSGRTFFIDNVGSCFLVTEDVKGESDYITIGHFSVLSDALHICGVRV